MIIENWWLVIGGVLVYFLPTLIGFNKKNLREVLLLNIFFGWTVIGWIWALVWAISGKAPLPKEIKKALRDNEKAED
jgi:uncharacterized membrane protein YccC